METNNVINVQMTKELFDTLGSGGNGGGSTNGHEIIYVDVSQLNRDVVGGYLSFMSIAMKVSREQNTNWVAVLHPLMRSEVQGIIYKSLAIDLDIAYSDASNAEDIKTVREVFESMGGIDVLPKITKEQFYNLNN